MADDVEPEPDLDLGHPGASAGAEYERRLRRAEARRRARFGRYLAPVVGALAGPDPHTVVWKVGGRGEEELGYSLTRAVGDRGIVLHDRAIRRSRANIDHIALVPSGVWVIDTKRYRGRVERRGGWFGSSPTLFVNRRNRTKEVTGVARQAELVRDALGTEAAEVTLRPVLCFVGAEWGWWAKPFSIGEVLVIGPRRLAGLLRGAGPLDGAELETLARRLAAAFPAYAPSGTSHKPTGA
jgi:hypothetical protein